MVVKWLVKSRGADKLTSQLTNNVRKPFLSNRGRHSRRITMPVIALSCILYL